MLRIDGNVLFSEFVAIVGHNQMVRSNVEPDGPIARTNRLAVDECIRFLGGNLYPQPPWLGVLCKGGSVEQKCPDQNAAKCAYHSMLHWTTSCKRTINCDQLFLTIQTRV